MVWWAVFDGGLGPEAATAGFGSIKGPKGTNVFGVFFLSERFVFWVCKASQSGNMIDRKNETLYR